MNDTYLMWVCIKCGKMDDTDPWNVVRCMTHLRMVQTECGKMDNMVGLDRM